MFLGKRTKYLYFDDFTSIVLISNITFLILLFAIRYQNKSMKGSEFVFDYVHFFYYKCHKINPNRGELYRDSPD